MYTSIDNRFVLVEGNENANFTKLISDLKKDNRTFYEIEPERRFCKESKTEIISPRIVIDCDDGLLNYDEYAETLEKHKKNILFQAMTVLGAKYLIVFADSRDHTYANEQVFYSDRDIIGEFDSFEEADLAFTKLDEEYLGTREILLLAEFYLLGDHNVPTFVGHDLLGSISNVLKETYSITSADYYDGYYQISGNDYGVTCALNKKILDYVNPEKAQKAFDIIKSVFEGDISLSDLKDESTMQLIEDGMLVPVQETLSMLESVYENNNLTVVLVKETYKKTAIGEKPEFKKRQIIDCIAEDIRF